MTMTYPIWVNASYHGVLNIIIETIFVANAAIKHAETIYISFFSRPDVIIRSFI